MRNRTATFVFILFSIVSYSQNDFNYKIDDSNQIYFELISEIEGQNKDALFLKGKEWIYDLYKSGDDVISLEDKEAGKIIGKGKSSDLIYNNSGIKKNGGHFTYKISLYFKEGKAKIKIDDLQFLKGEMLGVNDGARFDEEFPATWKKFGKKQKIKQWQKMRKQASEEFYLILKSFQSFLEKNNDEDDW